MSSIYVAIDSSTVFVVVGFLGFGVFLGWLRLRWSIAELVSAPTGFVPVIVRGLLLLNIETTSMPLVLFFVGIFNWIDYFCESLCSVLSSA